MNVLILLIHGSGDKAATLELSLYFKINSLLQYVITLRKYLTGSPGNLPILVFLSCRLVNSRYSPEWVLSGHGQREGS